jgi:CheY-like chemotaxis protein/two-component sensor histidine kinase
MTKIGKLAAGRKKKNYAFEKIEDASSHLLGGINDVIDMSKLEAGKFELYVEEFNFEKMLQKVINVTGFRVDEKRQKLEVYLDPAIPRLLIGDDQRLTQVITNLLTNAVKFTPEQGSIRIDTRFVKEENGLCTIQIEVTDTGIGISAEQQARLFTSFEQAESSISRKFGGTGLGLAICRNIVELMGGSIWLKSAPGAGSTFAFTVQLERSADETGGPDGADWKNVRLLAVDNDSKELEYFTGIVRRGGIACDTAANGREALQLIENNGPYNMCFIDWNIPGMNSMELPHEIKAQNRAGSIIIMTSPAEWNVIEKEAKTAGIDDFLPKPLFPSAVIDCVSKYTGKTDSHSADNTDTGKMESFKGYRLLLAEDVEINRDIVMELLKPTEIEIDCAKNGAEAVKMFSAAPERYDMIFMDIQMPEMDGLEATRVIRRLNSAKARDIPIVAMTANVFREDVEKCLDAGMDDHVGKPLDMDEVLAKLKFFLKPE